MKRNGMRCRANHSGQAWPGQAIEAVSAHGSLGRFSGTDLIRLRYDSSLGGSATIPAACHTLTTSGRFRSSSKIEPAIDTHSRRHTPSV
jgi:hypothetical protein